VRATLEAWEFKGFPKDFYKKTVLPLRLDYTEELCARIQFFMCMSEIKKDNWLQLWNNTLPMSEKSLYNICNPCYTKIIKFIEQEHQKVRG